MYLNDPIADMLTRMRNAQHGRRTECRAPWSRIKEQMCTLIQREGYIEAMRVDAEGTHKELVITFLATRPPLELKRISKPGSRRYAKAESFNKILHGFSLAILSTSSGLLTHREARQRKMGGEVLCLIA